MIIVWSRVGWHFATLIDWYSYASFSEHCVDPDMNIKCFRCELQAPLFFKYDYDSSMTFFLLWDLCISILCLCFRNITFSHSLKCFIFCNLCKKVAFVLWHRTLNQYTHHIHSQYFFGIKILLLRYSYHCVQFSNYVCIDITKCAFSVFYPNTHIALELFLTPRPVWYVKKSNTSLTLLKSCWKFTIVSRWHILKQKPQTLCVKIPRSNKAFHFPSLLP